MHVHARMHTQVRERVNACACTDAHADARARKCTYMHGCTRRCAHAHLEPSLRNLPCAEVYTHHAGAPGPVAAASPQLPCRWHRTTASEPAHGWRYERTGWPAPESFCLFRCTGTAQGTLALQGEPPPLCQSPCCVIHALPCPVWWPAACLAGMHACRHAGRPLCVKARAV